MSQKQSEINQLLKHTDSQSLLRACVERFANRAALASSFSAEDQVITHMLCDITSKPHIFTLDTGRLPQETYDLIEATREHFGITIQMMIPDTDSLADLTTAQGPNLFLKSVELRKQCCHVRKVEPLRRKLSQLDVWITGQRRQQSLTRAQLEQTQWDQANDLIKVNPLVDWTTEQVWDYIRKHNIPYNKLHDRGYPSIGCAPCTRAVKESQDIRSGRWWWEDPQHKECGLHLDNVPESADVKGDR